MSKVKTMNEAQINGLLFDRPDLRVIEYGDKKDKVAIAGRIQVLTNPSESAQNVVDVDLFQSKTYNNGKENPNYATVKSLMDDEPKVYMIDEHRATTVRISGNVNTQEYYRDTGKGAEGLELVEYNAPQGQFIHINENVNPQNAFEVDAIIRDFEEKEDNQGQRYMLGTAWVFDFRNHAQTLKFRVEEDGAIDFIMSNYVKGETYARLAGEFFAQTVTTEADNAELGYGESGIKQEYEVKSLLVTALGNPKDIPEGLLESGLKARDARLADVKSKAIAKLGTVGSAVDNSFEVNDDEEEEFQF